MSQTGSRPSRNPCVNASTPGPRVAEGHSRPPVGLPPLRSLRSLRVGLEAAARPCPHVPDTEDGDTAGTIDRHRDASEMQVRGSSLGRSGMGRVARREGSTGTGCNRVHLILWSGSRGPGRASGPVRTCGDYLCVSQEHASDARFAGRLSAVDVAREGSRETGVTDADFGVGSIDVSSPRDRRPGFDQQTARINVDDDTWRAFRRICLDDDEPISVVLGRLVDHQVARRRPATRPDPVKPPRPRVDTSTREQATSTAATATRAGPISEALSLFDQPAGDAPYT